MSPTVGEVKKNLQRFDTRGSSPDWDIPEGFRKASVLIPLFFRSGEPHVLLTVRSGHLKNHPGNVAFPGGRHEEGDTDEVHTALREAEEEIGLDPQNVEIIAVLHPTFVRPDHCVTPVIGIIPDDFRLKKNSAEVSLVFDLPLSRFLLRDYNMVKLPFLDRINYLYSWPVDIGGKPLTVWGFTGVYCFMVAIVAFQSEKTLQGTNGNIIDKNNAFQGGLEYLKLVYDAMCRMNVSKL